MPISTRRTRKPAKDPAVEQLLQMKDNWKGEVSQLIWDLIAFKRGLNGRGDPNRNLPPTKVTQPFDGSYSELLTEMASEYQTVAQQALEIIQRQEEVSQQHAAHRERKMKTRMERPRQAPEGAPSETPEAPKPENPLAQKFQEQPEMARTAGPLSRTWYRVKSPFSNETGRKTRVDMLLKLVGLKHDLEEMQDASVSLGNADGDRLSQSFQLYSAKIFDLHRLYQQYADELGKGEFVRNRNILFNDQSQFVSEFKRYYYEFRLADAMGVNGFHKSFAALADMFKKATNDIERKDLIDKMQILYERLIKYLGRAFRTKNNERWRTVQELYNIPKEMVEYDKESGEALSLPGTEVSPLEQEDEPEPNRVSTPSADPLDANEAADINSPLIVEAHNVLTRMLKRKRMNLPFGDWSASTRSKLFDELAAARQTVKAFMKAIEDDRSFEDLLPFLSSLKTGFDQVQRDVSFLLVGKMPKEKKAK